MSSISGIGGHALASDPLSRAAAARQIQEGLIDNSGAASPSAAVATSRAVGRFFAAPPLSAAVAGTLISDQAQGTSGTTTGVAPPSPADSAPLTLHQIASRYDVHHLTAEQAAQLRGDLEKSGALSHDDARNLFIINAVPSESFGHWDGHTLTGTNDVTTTPAGSTFDETQRVQTYLKSDQYFGNTKNVSAEQGILKVLNTLDQLRSSSTA